MEPSLWARTCGTRWIACMMHAFPHAGRRSVENIVWNLKLQTELTIVTLNTVAFVCRLKRSQQKQMRLFISWVAPALVLKDKQPWKVFYSITSVILLLNYVIALLELESLHWEFIVIHILTLTLSTPSLWYFIFSWKLELFLLHKQHNEPF